MSTSSEYDPIDLGSKMQKYWKEYLPCLCLKGHLNLPQSLKKKKEWKNLVNKWINKWAPISTLPHHRAQREASCPHSEQDLCAKEEKSVEIRTNPSQLCQHTASWLKACGSPARWTMQKSYPYKLFILKIQVFLSKCIFNCFIQKWVNTFLEVEFSKISKEAYTGKILMST